MTDLGNRPRRRPVTIGLDGATVASRPRFRRSSLRGTTVLDPIGRRAPVDLPCQVHDAELWFAEVPTDLERAKALCAQCPVQLACLSGAIERREPAGVWGGQIFDRGRIVTHKRPRGRPRKGTAVPERYPEWPQSA